MTPVPGTPIPIQRADGQTYVGANIQIDGFLMYNNCKFNNCTMMFSGGAVMLQPNCAFENCSWMLGGMAANTLAFLQRLYAMSGRERESAETFIKAIRGEIQPSPKTSAAPTTPFDPTKKTVH